MIRTLRRVDIGGHVPSGIGHPDHPMRLITRQIAGLESGDWASTMKSVAALFDGLAPQWTARVSAQTIQVVEDALTRGLDPLIQSNQFALESGSGIGAYTPLITRRFATVVSVDISKAMLDQGPEKSLRVQADGAQLPIRGASVDALILINAFLFPTETARVLRNGGAVLWVNTSGDQTPIHLSTAEVASSIPFQIEGVESRAGAGTWCCLIRRGPKHSTSGQPQVTE